MPSSSRRMIVFLAALAGSLLLAGGVAAAKEGGPVGPAIGKPDLQRIQQVSDPDERHRLLNKVLTSVEIRRGTPADPGALLRTIQLTDLRGEGSLTLDPALLGWYKPPFTYLGGGVYGSEDSISWYGRNLPGHLLWTLTYTMEWHWNGSVIVRGSRWSTADVKMLGWRWNGIMNGWNSGGKGYTFWRNGQQGHFSLLDYNGFALQNSYPWNEMTSYRDGSLKWAQG